MKKILIILTIFITSCTLEEYDKPYIIIYKSTDCIGRAEWEECYAYVDKGKHYHSFKDSIGKYNIGDTIK